MIMEHTTCICESPMLKIQDLKYCQKCNGKLPALRVFGYTIPQIKEIIDFAKHHGYNEI